MAKKILTKIWNIFTTVLAFSFIILGTAFTFYYANGYRFNPINGQVKQTGVISTQTIPTKAEVSINGKDIGKSPKVSAVDIGFADVKVSKVEYYTWEKKVPVIPEKSTTLQPTLFLEKPQAENIYSLKGALVKQIPNIANNSLLLLVLQDGEYTIVKYSTTKSFWNIAENPQTIYKTSATNIKKIDIQMSLDGKFMLLTKTSNTKIKSFEILKVDIPYEVIKADDLDAFSTDYTITWSDNSNFLILESTQDIIAYKYTDGTKYLLLKKNPKIHYIWTTDSEGFFYYIVKTIEKDLVKFSLLQTTLQGSSRKTLLKDVYLQNTDKYINEIRNENILEYITLKNAKENTRFAGDIVSFKVFPNSNGVLFFTTYSAYWYDQLEEKYAMISAWPINLTKVSPDSKKLIYFDSRKTEYSVFTFNKVEEDPLTTLGSKIILTGSTISDIVWSDDSQNIFFVDNNNVYVTDYDGTNNHKLIESTGSYMLTDDLEYIYQTKIQTESNSIEIMRYRLY